jgi:alcohol dehydrogenase class IV
MNFQFFTPTQLVIGKGESVRAGEFAAARGGKAFLVLSPSIQTSGAAKNVLDSLASKKIQIVEHIKPSGEPSVERVNEAAAAAQKAQCDLVVSLGGGSAIDLGKAVAGLSTNGGKIEDYLEGVGKGCAVVKPALPHIAIPTTAGAGAEVTRNAVIRSAEGRFKKSFRSTYLYPTVAILDAELTVPLSPQQTAYSGMDAITQLMEAFLCRNANPITDALALYGLELALSSIHEVFRDGSAIEHRENMLVASTLSGVCLANAGLGLAHGFASGLGALYDIQHGKACAILLPHAMKFCRCAKMDKLSRAGRLLGGDKTLRKGEYTDLLIQTIVGLNAEFGVPNDLRALNIPRNEFPLLVKMSMGNSMSGSPITITETIALTILEALT